MTFDLHAVSVRVSVPPYLSTGRVLVPAGGTRSPAEVFLTHAQRRVSVSECVHFCCVSRADVSVNTMKLRVT